MTRIVFGATLADDSVYQEFSTQRRVQGRDDIVSAIYGWKQPFPDAKGTIQNIIVGGNQGVAEVVWEGTHQADLVGLGGTVPASGKRARIPASYVVTVEGGKIKEVHHYFDFMDPPSAARSHSSEVGIHVQGFHPLTATKRGVGEKWASFPYYGE